MLQEITLEAGIGIASLTITLLGLFFKLCSSKEKDGESPRNKDGDKPKKILAEDWVNNVKIDSKKGMYLPKSKPRYQARPKTSKENFLAKNLGTEEIYKRLLSLEKKNKNISSNYNTNSISHIYAPDTVQWNPNNSNYSTGEFKTVSKEMLTSIEKESDDLYDSLEDPLNTYVNWSNLPTTLRGCSVEQARKFYEVMALIMAKEYAAKYMPLMLDNRSIEDVIESERIELLYNINGPLYTQDYSKIHYDSRNTGPR